jgi:hypothetical protein
MSKLFLRIVFLALMIFAIAVLPAQAQNQSEPVLSSLEVDFWPEYDRPELLVIYRAELAPSVTLPVDLTFRIPARVGAPHAVATGQSNDTLFTVTSTRQVDGDWAYITFTTTMPIIRLEFYDPVLQVNEPLRQYEFNWWGDYAVEELMLLVQQPCDSSGMQISPALGSGVAGTDGLVYYSGTFGPLSAGQTFDLSFSYQKSSDCLSIQSASIATELPENTTGRTSFLRLLPYILGLIGVMLILGGVFWYWKSGRQEPSGQLRTHRSRRPGPERHDLPDSGVSAPMEGSIYCHNCGKRAAPNDKFCRSCGTRLRAT